MGKAEVGDGSPDVEIWEIASDIPDKRSKDRVLVKPNEDDFFETFEPGQSTDTMPYHGPSCYGKERFGYIERQRPHASPLGRTTEQDPVHLKLSNGNGNERRPGTHTALEAILSHSHSSLFSFGILNPLRGEYLLVGKHEGTRRTWPSTIITSFTSAK